MNTVSKEDFCMKACKLLDTYATEFSGDILYSSPRTLQKGDYYFLGINPGGPTRGKKIAETLKEIDDANQYIDAVWGNHEKGCAPLQLRAQQLFKRIFEHKDDDPIRNVLCTNLVFHNSSNAKKIRMKDEYVDYCWKVHEYLLDIVQPTTIIAYGNLPFFVVADRLGLDERKETDALWSNWKLRAARKHDRSDTSWRDKVKLIGLPHLSWYSPWNRQDRADHVVNFIKQPPGW